MSQYTEQSESRDIEPLRQGWIIEAKGQRYKVDRWFTPAGHCFEFSSVDVDSNIQPFVKTPSEVAELIKTGIIKIHTIPNN
jgi:hypothetical protein